MRFLLDQGLPRSAAAELVRLGHEAEHIGDPGSIRAPDEAIVELATGREAVAVTLDADFHRIVALGNRTRPSVIFLREQGLKGAAVAQIVAAVASQHAESSKRRTDFPPQKHADRQTAP